MGRRRKYENRHTVTLVIEKKIYDEMLEKKGAMGFGEFIAQLYLENRDKAILLGENSKLKKQVDELMRENEMLKKRIEQLEAQVEKLKSKSRALKKATDDALEKLYRVLDEKKKIKVLEALRVLGYQESGEALQKRAREFINSLDELGLEVERKDDVGPLGWLVFKKPAP